MVEKISPQAGLNPRTTRSLGQHLTHRATGASQQFKDFSMKTLCCDPSLELFMVRLFL